MSCSLTCSNGVFKLRNLCVLFNFYQKGTVLLTVVSVYIIAMRAVCALQDTNIYQVDSGRSLQTFHEK